MGRPSDGPTARDATITVRITSKGMDVIDQRRGQWSRSEYVREALKLASKTNLKGPTA